MSQFESLLPGGSTAVQFPARFRGRPKPSSRLGAEAAPGRPSLASGVPTCPGHAFWKRDFLSSSGLFSVLLSPCSRAALVAMLDRLKLFGKDLDAGFEMMRAPV
jgi:hypothetical protein